MPVPRAENDEARRTSLVSCTAARTLLARRTADGGTVLVKLFSTGSLADAQREVEFGRLLRGLGVPRHDEARIDPTTGEPAIVMELLHGTDLAERIGRHGPMAGESAARIALELARIVERFGAHTSSRAPRGVAHCDIKPSNVFLATDRDVAPARDDSRARVLLLDLEHAATIAPPGVLTPAANFTGGTHGFAPPEAYEGSAPTAAFDVFGIGCSLHVLLSGSVPFSGRDTDGTIVAVRTGRRRRWLLRGCPTTLGDLVDRCLSKRPADRPTAAQVVRSLEHYLEAEAPLGRGLEQARIAVLAGQLPLAAQLIDSADDDADPEVRAELSKLLQRRQRVLARVGEPDDIDETADTAALAHTLARRAPELAAFLQRFPAHEVALTLRERVLRSAGRLLTDVPPTVAAHKRAARFAEAERLLDDTLTTLAEAQRLGRVPPPRRAQDLRHPMQRDPARFLGLARKDVETAAVQHLELTAQLEAAEAAIDLAAANRVIDGFAAVYGGASEVVAGLKDRLHRLEFYLARIGKQASALAELERLVDTTGIDVDLKPLSDLLRLCTAHVAGLDHGEGAFDSLRALRRSVQDLSREYPHLEPHTRTALGALEAALREITVRAGQLVEDAQHKLSTPPIPIRPLQSILGRLDHLRMLEVLVDRPDRSRSALLDEIENLRLRLEQARSTRDRLARGAQEAMDRGHLTTALYDMARAVNQFTEEAGADERSGSGVRLAEQFEEAKRRKRAVEDALRDSNELTGRYAAMWQDPDSRPSDRLMVVQEQEHLLSFLCANMGPERTEPYRQELREVQFRILAERAAEGEQLLGSEGSEHHRLAVAQQTYDALQLCVPEHGWNQAHVAEARTILTQWRNILDEAVEEVRSSQDARQHAERQSRRRWLWRSTAAALLIVALSFAAYRVAFAAHDPAVDHSPTRLDAALGPAVTIRGDSGRPTFDGDAATAALLAFVGELRARDLNPRVLDTAAALLQSVQEAHGPDVEFAAEDWLPRFTRAVSAYDEAIAAVAADPDLEATLLCFGRRAHFAGFVMAALRGAGPQLEHHLEATRNLRITAENEQRDLLTRLR